MHNNLPDLFPGFDSITVEANEERLFCRVGGSGPPLLLLHGYPQSHVCWHKIASRLAEHFTVIAADLPGYGRSSIPPLSEDHMAYSKRAMAATFVEMMRVLGHTCFFMAGHDRGGRVAYRMALDHPDRIQRLAVLDILPTCDYWDRMDRAFGLKIYHWMFLAQPAPFPEKLIAASPIRFLTHTLRSWTAAKSLSCFSEGAMTHNRAWFCDPDRISATCEDYRAGAGIDYDHDRQSLEDGQRIKRPLLALWGDKGIAMSVKDPLEVWRGWSPMVEGLALPSGHFLPEEAPAETFDALFGFFAV
ncbi:alpha/beta fold hydrolase [Roseibium sediminicola]|uniref:Alpha/beta hydrolase n=1 Tax=Roseibium sediminicola TaxID=2933272 RepID=A0ABT0GMQ1_9HYPH|nr:alpha/beta hydrolase [Roseibium sp. CAU 1639]MCK7610711.1 alpha/beta hydrolase [Roseibium sp. CAU 1639]